MNLNLSQCNVLRNIAVFVVWAIFSNEYNIDVLKKVISEMHNFSNDHTRSTFKFRLSEPLYNCTTAPVHTSNKPTLQRKFTMHGRSKVVVATSTRPQQLPL